MLVGRGLRAPRSRGMCSRTARNGPRRGGRGRRWAISIMPFHKDIPNQTSSRVVLDVCRSAMMIRGRLPSGIRGDSQCVRGCSQAFAEQFLRGAAPWHSMRPAAIIPRPLADVAVCESLRYHRRRIRLIPSVATLSVAASREWHPWVVDVSSCNAPAPWADEWARQPSILVLGIHYRAVEGDLPQDLTRSLVYKPLGHRPPVLVRLLVRVDLELHLCLDGLLSIEADHDRPHY